MTYNPHTLPTTLAQFASAHGRGGFAFTYTNAEFADHLRAMQAAVPASIHGWLQEEASMCELDPACMASADDRATVAAKLCASVQSLHFAGHKALTHVRVNFLFDQGLVLAVMRCCISGLGYTLTEVLREDGSIDDGPGQEELALPENAETLKAADQCGIQIYAAMSEYIGQRLSRSPKLRSAIQRAMSLPPEIADD